MKIAFLKNNKWYNRVTSWWTHGPYAHCELLIVQREDGKWLTGTSVPFRGVSLEWKEFSHDDPEWDTLDCPLGHPLHAQAFFEQINHTKYDYLGLLGFVWRRGHQLNQRWFCSEAIAASIGLKNPWRYCPNTLYDILISLKHN